MNLLIDTLPETVLVTDTQYQVNSDFRTCLRVVMALEDNDLTPQEKQIVVLANLFPKMPTDIQAAMQAAEWFLNGGREYADKPSTQRVVSFEKDAPLIYSAFRQTHGIDLSTIHLHWWQFLALMQGLDSESNFRQLVNLRVRIQAGKATQDEIDMAQELGDVFDVPAMDERTLEEKDQAAEFWRLVSEAEKKREQS